jgi:hypothetical protein
MLILTDRVVGDVESIGLVLIYEVLQALPRLYAEIIDKQGPSVGLAGIDGHREDGRMLPENWSDDVPIQVKFDLVPNPRSRLAYRAVTKARTRRIGRGSTVQEVVNDLTEKCNPRAGT